jgi:hypothetical protein
MTKLYKKMTNYAKKMTNTIRKMANNVVKVTKPYEIYEKEPAQSWTSSFYYTLKCLTCCD